MDSFIENHKEFMKDNKSKLKSQERFRSKVHNVFTEEVNKIARSTNDDKRIQSIDSIESYAYRTRKYLACKKHEIKCNNITKQYKR